LEQNRTQIQYRPPIVSGSEDWRQRTGVVYRSPSQSMTNSVPAMAPHKKANPRMEQLPVTPEDCTGMLPCEAPLANPYVPFQRSNPSRYHVQRALARGTLYPGLDLPLLGMVNADKAASPLTELMALHFAVKELGLYLDTHPEDKDALNVFRDYTDRAEAAKTAYEAKHGPLMVKQAGSGDCWDWVCDPWPWDYCQEG